MSSSTLDLEVNKKTSKEENTVMGGAEEDYDANLSI